MKASAIGVLLVATLAGCAEQGVSPATVTHQPTARAPAPGPVSVQTGTYVGDLPCADCPGIRHIVVLRPDAVFFYRMIYLGRERSVDDIGRWSFSADGNMLVLRGQGEAPVMFAVKQAGVLRKLDLKGQEIRSQLNYDLRLTADAPKIEPRLLLRGMYRYFADTGIFEECLTGLKMPVAQEADNATPERAYVAARSQPGARLLVSLDGRIAKRAPMEGPGERDTLIVERFNKVSPGRDCVGEGTSAPALENTRWKLIRLGARAVEMKPGGREPFLMLIADGNRAHGSTGCNRFTGGYRLEGEALHFTPIATTKMMCAEGMEVEQRFLQRLAATVRWKLAGGDLELYDAGGAAIARFVAAPAK